MAPAAVAIWSSIASRGFVKRMRRWLVEPTTELVTTTTALAPTASLGRSRRRGSGSVPEKRRRPAPASNPGWRRLPPPHRFRLSRRYSIRPPRTAAVRRRMSVPYSIDLGGGSVWSRREIVCQPSLPQLGHRPQVSLLPVAFQRIPPSSQIDRSKPQDRQRTIQARDSASIEVTQERGASLLISCWVRLKATRSLVSFPTEETDNEFRR